jgi:hypothetical protein
VPPLAMARSSMSSLRSAGLSLRVEARRPAGNAEVGCFGDFFTVVFSDTNHSRCAGLRGLCRAADVHLAHLGQRIDVARIRETLELVHPLHRRRLEAGLGRVGVGNDGVNFHPHDAQLAVNPLRKSNSSALDHDGGLGILPERFNEWKERLAAAGARAGRPSHDLRLSAFICGYNPVSFTVTPCALSVLS